MLHMETFHHQTGIISNYLCWSLPDPDSFLFNILCYTWRPFTIKLVSPAIICAGRCLILIRSSLTSYVTHRGLSPSNWHHQKLSVLVVAWSWSLLGKSEVWEWSMEPIKLYKSRITESKSSPMQEVRSKT